MQNHMFYLAFACKLIRPIHMRSLYQRRTLIKNIPSIRHNTLEFIPSRSLSTFANDRSSLQFQFIPYPIPTYLRTLNQRNLAVINSIRPFCTPIDPTRDKFKSPSDESSSSQTSSSKNPPSKPLAHQEAEKQTKPAASTTPKVLSSSTEKKVSPDKQAEKSAVSDSTSEQKTVAVKKSLWQRIVAELKHYYHGFKLLYLETKVAGRLLFGALFLGKHLTRRERRQLVRTVADLFRMLPFLVFVIVPFMELLLPFYLKFFPFMLPSTFQEEKKELEKRRQLLKGKLEMAKFLQDTLDERMGAAQFSDAPTVHQFSEFLKEVRETGRLASTQDIMKFSQLFEDEYTLESLDHATLKGICKLLELNSIGPAQLLRFQIRMQMKKLYVDDELIRIEGVDKLPVWDLQMLCRERGMRALGVSEERLRFQLSQWLELHLDKKVPVMLLILTRTMYLPETLTTNEQITEVISRLPDNVSKEAVLKAAPSTETGRVDNQTVYELVKEEEARLKEEAKASKAAAAAAAKKVAEAQKKETLVDKAPILNDQAASLEESTSKLADKKAAATAEPSASSTSSGTAFQDPSWGNISPEMQAEVTANDLAQIESAIESIVSTRTALDEEELQDLKDSLAETTALKQQKLSSDSSTSTKTKISKAAGRLEMNVQRLIAEVDNIVYQLKDEQSELQSQLEANKTEDTNRGQLLKSIEDSKERTIGVEDLLQSLRRLEKAPDEARMQKILKLLDEDNDGKIEMTHVSQIVELLSNENVKLTGKEVKKVLDTIDKEAFVEDVQKRQRLASSQPSPVNDKDPSDKKD